MSLCKCGCKGQAPEGKGFIDGHAVRKFQRKQEHEQKLTERSEVSISCEEKSLPHPLIPDAERIIEGRKWVDETISKLTPQIPPTRRDREIQLMELELKQIDKYMGDRHQNTHITEAERILLSILRKDVAMHPWSISKRVCQDMGIPFKDEEFEIDILKNFVDDYLDFGLPVDREGRKEVKEIFKAYFEGKNAEEEKPKETLIK